MRFDINTNTLLNDIMANNTSAVMLFAPAGTGKTDFLTELAGRYRTVYWISATTVDIRLFAYYLVEKVLTDDPCLKFKLNQLLFSKSEFNGDGVVLTAVLDYIAKIKGNCLMVFERMERLPEDFDLSLIERLIKHCPPNLKIVISSDKYINFDYTKFEPMYPTLIDETILLPRDPSPDFEKYLRDVSEEDKAFLVYISDLVSVDVDFIKELHPRGADLLYYLNRKESYVATRDVKTFRPNTLLRNYLAGLKEKYREINSGLEKIPAVKRYAEFLLKTDRLMSAADYFTELSDYAMLDECARRAINEDRYLLRLPDLAQAVKRRNFEYREDRYDYRYFYALIQEARGEYPQAIENLKGLAGHFMKLGPDRTLAAVLNRLARLTQKFSPEDVSYGELFKEAFAKFDKGSANFLTALSIPFRKEVGVGLQDAEAFLESPEAKDRYFYIKSVEELGYAYFELGNYKRALEVMRGLKAYFPQYVIPHNFIAFVYFGGDVKEAERMAREALSFALENDITKDISLLYTTLAMIDVYYNLVDEAFEKYDAAVRLDKLNNAVKFYNIGQRCIAYAKFKSPGYAKETAHIYLKYCETFAPKYENIMQLALAYSYLRMGEQEKAYDLATKAIQSGKPRTTNWLLGMAIATDYMLSKGDLKDAATLVRNILKTSYAYGLEMLVVDYYYDVFINIIAYAKAGGIETEYIRKIEDSLSKKRESKVAAGNLKVNMFGAVSAYASGKEIKWKTKKSRDLFFRYLLAKEEGVERGEIIEFLWKDYLYESAINNLKTTNNIIRKTLSATGASFDLAYVNSKYVLRIKNIESDYENYLALREKLAPEEDTAKKVEIMNGMLKLYKGDLASDVEGKEFSDERKNVKQELIINLLKLIRALAKQGDFIEAKRYLSSLILIDPENDYKHMEEELDSHIDIIK
jgi:Response regulator containing CheY-like receiver and SARP domains